MKELMRESKIFRYPNDMNVEILHTIIATTGRLGMRITAQWSLFYKSFLLYEKHEIPIKSLWLVADYIERVKQNPFPANCNEILNDFFNYQDYAVSHGAWK